MIAFSNATATGGSTTTTSSIYIYMEEEKLWETELWETKLRERRAYLKSMWLEVLKLKCYFTSEQYVNCKLYYRRLLISISGWLAREGYAKKN